MTRYFYLILGVFLLQILPATAAPHTALQAAKSTHNGAQTAPNNATAQPAPSPQDAQDSTQNLPIEFPFIYELRQALLGSPLTIYSCPSAQCAVLTKQPHVYSVQYFYKLFDDEKGYGDWVRIESYKDSSNAEAVEIDGYIQKSVPLYPMTLVLVVDSTKDSPSQVKRSFEYRACLEATCPIIFNSRTTPIAKLSPGKKCIIVVETSHYYDLHNNGWIPMTAPCFDTSTHSTTLTGFIHFLDEDKPKNQ